VKLLGKYRPQSAFARLGASAQAACAQANMAMCLQPFLCVAEHLALERELPAAVSTALDGRGFPPLASAKKIKSKLHEFWQLEFSAAVPPSLGPVGKRGNASRAVLQIIGAELSDKPVFSVRRPTTAGTIAQALKLAQAAGVAAPNLWLSGTIPRRGPYRDVNFVVYEYVTSDTVEDAVAAPPAERARIESGVVAALKAAPQQAEDGELAEYADVHAFVAELQALAKEAEAVDLAAPLARLAAECRTPVTSGWQLGAAQRTLAADLSGANLLCSCADESTATWSLDGVLGWHAAALCDARLVSAAAEAPWDLVQALSHVVKARWVCERSRRDPAAVPRCSVHELLEMHDQSQAVLVQRGYLPTACILPGCSTARLVETFPEELCPHY